MWARISYARAGPWRQDLERLAARGLSHAAIARQLMQMHPGQTFTRRQVHYHLHEDDRVAQDGECVPLKSPDVWHRRRVHQMHQGFGHLLPDLTLRHRESDILALLREEGRPLTRPQMAEQLGVRHLRSNGRHYLGRLRRLGLVESHGLAGQRKRYALAPGALSAVG
jgi:hypothetical protein